MEATDLGNTLQIAKLFQFERIVLLIIGIAVLFYLVRIVSRFSARLHFRFPSKRLLILQIATISSFAIYILGSIFIVYAVLRPPKELLVALGGSIAVALGFAMKDIVASIIAGLILLFDRPFQVGDRVTFGNVYGEIVSIGLRTVRLATLDDNLVTIPNSKFITDYVSSGNAGALDMMVCVDFYTALSVDIAKVEDLLKELVITSRYAYLKKPIAVVLSESELGFQLVMKFTVKAYVLDVRYEKAFQSDIVKRGNEVLRKEGILRPNVGSAE